MAKEEIKIKTERREEHGSGAARRLLRAGFVPAAINRIEGGSVMVKLNAREFENMLRHHASNQLLVTLDLDGQPVPALLREVQTDVMDGHVIHADFGEISLTRKLRVSINLRLAGEPDGVKNEGGILEQTLRQIEVECLPADIIEVLTVDVSALKLGQAMAVRDLKLGPGYTLITHGEVSVATVVEAPAEEVAAEAAAPAEGATPGSEPEIITKGKKEEGEEGAAPAEGGKGEKKDAAKPEKKGAEKKGGDEKKK